MANYNTDLTFGPVQWLGTELQPRTGVIERVASNGKVRMRSTQSADKVDAVVVHATLTQSQIAEFKSFRNANRVGTFLFTGIEDGVQRTVAFAGQTPYKVEGTPDGLWQLTVYLREV